MSIKALETIRSSLPGRRIIRGPWRDGDAVCALQAVLDRHGWQPGEPRIPALCRILGVDAFWLRRFMMGFDRAFQIRIVDEDGGEELDEVSRAGIRIGKEFAT